MKAVLFDMDGVLIDSEAPSFERLRRTLEQKGVAVTVAELLERYAGMRSKAIHEDIIARYGFGQSPEAFRAEHRKRGGIYYADGELLMMDGLEKFLTLLREKGMRMAVVSSTSSVDVLWALNRLGILTYFDAAVCGDHVQAAKPDPAGYLMAAGFLGVEPGDCIIVEDSPIGIQAAKNAGIRVAGYAGSTHVQDTSAADVQVQSYRELAGWLAGQGLI